VPLDRLAFVEGQKTGNMDHVEDRVQNPIRYRTKLHILHLYMMLPPISINDRAVGLTGVLDLVKIDIGKAEIWRLFSPFSIQRHGKGFETTLS
jgi:hypothetical protein